MTFSLFKTSNKKLLSDKKAFFDALGRVDTSAVKLLRQKINYDVRQAARQTNLSPEDAEELLNDAVVITVTNIKKGKFLYTDFSPAAYAQGVVRKLIANRIRTYKPKYEELEKVSLASGFDPEKYLQDKERQSIIGALLERLGENCRQLIKMRYFRQLKDQEIIDQQLTTYSSLGSLKSKRSQCLKELGALARNAGIEKVF